MPLDALAKRSKGATPAAGGHPIEFVTIAVSDGISMGHEGMRASLVSREGIADSAETVMHAERFDAVVTFAGCDKSLPGMLMAAARLNLPSVFLYGGSILPGRGAKGEALEVVSVFEAVGARAPHIADMKPHGKYHMVDLDRVGGVPVVMKELLDAGLLHGGCMTVTGRTIAENLAALDPPAPDGDVVHRLNKPLHKDGGIVI